MSPLYRYSIRNPKRVLAAAILITMAVAPGVMRLRLRTDGNALLPTGAPAIERDEEIRDEFGVRDQIAVVLVADGPEGVFNVHTLKLVQDWTERFSEIEGIGPKNVISLATEKSDRVFPGTLKNRGFLLPWPKTEKDLEGIRGDLERIRLYTGTLLAFDDSATAILIGVPGGMDRVGLHRRLGEIIAERGPVPEEVHIVGAPVAESLLGTHILEDLGVPSVLMGRRIAGSEEAEPWRLPRTFYELRLFVGRHIGLVPIAIAIMALVFFVSFRSLAATMLPLGEVGACLAFVFGLMGWCGVPVYLTVAVLPVILTAMGIADEIHIFSRYRETAKRQNAETARCDDAEHRADTVRQTMDEMWRPVVKTSITTAIGFLSFALSPIAPVQAFGVFTAVGIIFCMFWSLTVIPACLVLLSPRRLLGSAWAARQARHAAEPRILSRASVGESLLHRTASAVIRFRYVALLVGLAILVVAPLGVRQVIVQDSWIDGFASDSEFYKATQLVNRLFHGTHILLVRVDVGDSETAGRVHSTELQHSQAKLPVEESVDAEEFVGQWLRICAADSPETGYVPAAGARVRYARLARIESADSQGDELLIRTIRHDGSIVPMPDYRGQEEEFTFDISPRRLLLPGPIRLIAGLEDFIEDHRADAVGGVLGTADYIATVSYMTGGHKEVRRRIPESPQRIRWLWRQYDRVRGTHRLREILNERQAAALITVFMENANYVSTRHLMEDIRRYERTELAEHGVSLEFAGDVAVSQTLIGAIVNTQVRSLLLSLLGILAVTAFMGRSFKWGIYCILPCSIAVLVNFAMMGVMHIPLGVATSMFSAMTLGIGVDYAIHLTERFRHVSDRGLDPVAAAIDAVKTTGPAIILDAVAIALGFGVMVLSQVPSNARLGGLVVLSVAVCLLVTLLLLPALLVLGRTEGRGLRTEGEGTEGSRD